MEQVTEDSVGLKDLIGLGDESDEALQEGEVHSFALAAEDDEATLLPDVSASYRDSFIRLLDSPEETERQMSLLKSPIIM